MNMHCTITLEQVQTTKCMYFTVLDNLAWGQQRFLLELQGPFGFLCSGFFLSPGVTVGPHIGCLCILGWGAWHEFIYSCLDGRPSSEYLQINSGLKRI